MPEPLLFALSLLQTFIEEWEGLLPTARGWSLPLVPEGRGMTMATVIPLTFELGQDSACSQYDFAASCLDAAVGMIGRAADAWADIPSFPELFSTAAILLKKLKSKPQSLPEVMSFTAGLLPWMQATFILSKL